ncbi:hypothetical protein VNI00_009055 [Paramarasmius palmivorus]|uniref:Uncharacterized protein n=1 Tax=Paramarasmius palmivorus TaxID=297713 RepID=A0AAW0CRF4_9AGAR
MSSDAFSTSSISFQSHHLHAQVLAVLRRSNEHYRQVAESLRQSIRPTFHARKRAYNLGLSVDIHKAINCPQRQVSVIPLPIIDTCMSPSSPFAQPLEDLNACLPPVIPYDVRLSGRSNAHKRLAMIPPIVIPSVHDPRRRPSITSQLGSHFSAITPDQNISVPMFNIHVWNSNMDLHHMEQVIPDDVIDDSETDVNWQSFTPVYLEDYDDDDCMMVSEDESSSQSSMYSTSGSSASSGSCGPRTPVDGSPMIICNKRKSFEEEERLDGQPPKYIRKLDGPIPARR